MNLKNLGRWPTPREVVLIPARAKTPSHFQGRRTKTVHDVRAEANVRRFWAEQGRPVE